MLASLSITYACTYYDFVLIFLKPACSCARKDATWITSWHEYVTIWWKLEWKTKCISLKKLDMNFSKRMSY
jgi:hypothetical protein